ncbi:MAG: DUF98 domain-containing protein [Methanomicrobiales archaeon]|nr:DUF98 domain-containing protein [Methanomicrobiales archaeon]
MESTVLDLINIIEKETGPLSNIERALLITDGSVTRLLEVFSNAPVGVRTICQKIIPASPDIAARLDISPDEPVNYREVDLYNKNNLNTLIHAISYAPISHLPENALVRLMNEDEPIGYIMRDEMMESRREIISLERLPSQQPGAGKPGISRVSSSISKSYRIIHNNRPIFLINEIIPENLFSERKTIRIQTPSRIHIGLLDMNGESGRVDGGAGITLDNPGFEIRISEADAFSVTSSDAKVSQNVESVIERLRANGLDIPPLHIHIDQAIPFHCGLGSGTQLALGLAAGISGFQGESYSDSYLIGLTGRGGTSGIGTKAFFQGGLIVDAGHRFGPGKSKSSFAPSSVSGGAGFAPLISRYEIPKEWNFVLAVPDGLHEIHGTDEVNIFQKCCPVPVHDVQVLSHILLMKLIPGIIEHDLDQFGTAINEFQEWGFKKCELDIQPPVIRTLIDSMRDAGASGVGMSSFGPVVYGVCDTGSSSVISAAEEVMNDYSGGKTILTKGRNQGAKIVS